MGTANFIEDEAGFDTLLAEGGLLIVDFTATWCGPCKVVGPLVDRLAVDYKDDAKVYKMDLDSNKPLAKKLEIKSIPAVMFFQNGELKETIIGVKPYEDFLTTIKKYL